MDKLITLIAGTLLVVLPGTDMQQDWNPGRHASDWEEWTPWEPPWLNYDNSVVVRTVYGDVKGFSVPWHTDDLDWDPAWEEHPPWATRRVNCFLGIPYAQAPLGKYRFDRPRKPRWGGLHWDANYFRPACPQTLDDIHRDIPKFPKSNVSEDCLYMNIYAPNMTYYLGPNQQYPVLIWINSGDFSTGTAQVHPGQVLATQGLVVVTFNYRLGVFGFLSLQDEHAPGNWGLFDQHMALEFVRENIKAFQGDPDRITLAGDGAGSASVGFHLISDMTRDKGFFHQCIMMSGSDLAKWAFLDPYWQPREYGLELGKRLGCPTHDTFRMLQCLRDNVTHSWESIFNASLQVQSRDGELGVVWAPTQDGGWFMEHPTIPRVPYLRYTPRDMRAMDLFDKSIPCIVGLNTQDGTKIANETEPSLSHGISRLDFQDYVISMLRDWEIQEMYLERAWEAIEFQYTYWPDPENRTARTQEFIHMLTDLTVGEPLNSVLQIQANYSPHWMYRFNYMSWNDWRPLWMGVSYSAAVPYVFGVPFMNETVLNETQLVGRQAFDYDDRNMSTWMMYLFTNFIKEGHPNPNVTLNVTWEPYNFHNLTYLVIDWHNYIWFMYRQEKYSFWREYFPTTAQQERYYATPTPAGYPYVIATGWMSATILVMVCVIAALSFMLCFQDELETKHRYPDHSIPLSKTGSRGHMMPPLPSQEDLNLSQDTSWQPSGTITTTTTLSMRPSGWQVGSRTDVPRGWTVGGGGATGESGSSSSSKGHTGPLLSTSGQGRATQSAAQIPLRNAGGYYSGTDFSDDDEVTAHHSRPASQWSGPDPYRTLERPPPPPPPRRPEQHSMGLPPPLPYQQQQQQPYRGRTQPTAVLPRIQHQSHSVV